MSAAMNLPKPQRGFSLIELMISIVISMLILAGLSAMLVNVSNSNAEMAKANSQIENGRFAVQVLESDLLHAGFWGKYVPEFDDLNHPFVPSDVPAAIPDPCLAFNAANWTRDYKNSLVGLAVHAGAGVPGTCVLSNKAANTDFLVVRRAATCTPGDSNCDVDVPGKMYFQSSMCSNATRNTAEATGNSASTIGLKAPSDSSSTLSATNAYNGMTIRILAGTGAGQDRVISAYDGTVYKATVTPDWTITPDNTSEYAIVESVLDTANFTMKNRGPDCALATAAEKRKFVSNIYYVRDYASTAGDGIPTLVRSSFDPGTTVALSHQAAEPLVEGIERFAVELGVDNLVSRCGFNTPTDYTDKPVKWRPDTCLEDKIDTNNNTLPRNRGDGSPDTYVRCTAATPCTLAQLRDTVAVKLYLLVRNSEKSAGYKDTKKYCLGPIPVGGNCDAADLAGPFNDGYKRHLFTTTVRLTSVSGRRESP